MTEEDRVNSVWQHMSKGRYIELSKSGEALTEEENKDWHYCPDWDFLLIHKSDPTFDCCVCGFKEGNTRYNRRPEDISGKLPD